MDSLPGQTPSRRSILRPLPGWFRLLLIVLGGGYALIVALLYFSQTSLIFAGRVTRGRPEAEVTPPEGAELLRLATRSGHRIAALYGPALTPDGKPHPDPRSCPTLVYFYGNGSYLRASRWEFDEFRRCGVNVLIPEYVGYGMSEGAASEQGCVETADAAYAYLLSRSDVDPRRIVAVGYSLGGAVAIDLASRQPLAGVAVFAAFTGMADAAAGQYPWVPVRLLLRHRFESERKLRQVRCPLLLVHGEQDSLVPHRMMTRLAAAAGGPVTQLSVPGAGHNDLFESRSPDVLEAFRSFVRRL